MCKKINMKKKSKKKYSLGKLINYSLLLLHTILGHWNFPKWLNWGASFFVIFKNFFL